MRPKGHYRVLVRGHEYFAQWNGDYWSCILVHSKGGKTILGRYKIDLPITVVGSYVNNDY